MGRTVVSEQLVKQSRPCGAFACDELIIAELKETNAQGSPNKLYIAA